LISGFVSIQIAHLICSEKKKQKKQASNKDDDRTILRLKCTGDGEELIDKITDTHLDQSN